MSYLAPFIEAVNGGDKVIAKLMEDNGNLRTQLRELRYNAFKVSVTGENGTPVYAETRLDQGHLDESDKWELKFQSSKMQRYPVDAPFKAYVHVGGLTVMFPQFGGCFPVQDHPAFTGGTTMGAMSMSAGTTSPTTCPHIVKGDSSDVSQVFSWTM